MNKIKSIMLIVPPTTRPVEFSAKNVRVSAFFPLGVAYLAAYIFVIVFNKLFTIIHVGAYDLILENDLYLKLAGIFFVSIGISSCFLRWFFLSCK